MPIPSPALKRRKIWKVLILIFCVALVAAGYFFRYDARAGMLLLQLKQNEGSALLLRLAEPSVRESACQITSPAGEIPCRIYAPVGRSHPPALLLVHGIHHLGMEDPRLVQFARTFAEHGILVVTPRISSLADYHIDASAVQQIGEAASALAKFQGGPVGVMGLSFAGGLSLLAAANPEYGSTISFVLSVGGYHDLAHVSRFLITGEAMLPDGTLQQRRVEQYGALVLAYDYADEIFSPAGVAQSRAALRNWLEENYAQARTLAATLDDGDRQTLEDLFTYKLRPQRAALLRVVREHTAELQQLSPHGNLRSLRVPVYLLHGEDDAVIPSSETLALEREVPAAELRQVLITSAVSHVQASATPTWHSQWRLLKFMAAIFRQLEREPRAAVQSQAVLAMQEKPPSSR